MSYGSSHFIRLKSKYFSNHSVLKQSQTNELMLLPLMYNLCCVKNVLHEF